MIWKSLWNDDTKHEDLSVFLEFACDIDKESSDGYKDVGYIFIVILGVWVKVCRNISV